MTKSDVLTVLAPLIFEEDGVEQIKTSDTEFGYTSIGVDVFVSRFEESDVTYAGLSANDHTEETWQSRFDEWLARGLLS